MVKIFQKYFGSIFFFFFSTWALMRVLIEPFPGHYRIFTEAAKLLWAGFDPYGHDFHSVGLWFYSPSCGMFFYSLFAYLPEKLGVGCYSLMSIFLFWWSTRYLFSFLFSISIKNVAENRHYQFTLLLSAVPMFQALLASKIEIIMVAIMSVCLVAFLKGKKILPAFFMGMILNWKFQPLPTVLLFFLAVFMIKKEWISFLLVILSSWFWYLLPLPFLGFEKSWLLQTHMTQSLNGFIQVSFLNYDNFYRFLSSGLLLAIDYRLGMVISSLVGVLFAIYLLQQVKSKNAYPQLKMSFLFAYALGNSFILLFSPMSQNNSSILAFPIFLINILLFSEINKKWFRWSLGVLTFLFLFVYSDLIPEHLRSQLRDISFKSFVLMVLVHLTWFGVRNHSGGKQDALV